MPRKTKSAAWVRTPEFEAAVHRAIAAAWQCAALFWEEAPKACPERDASERVKLTVMAMILFMTRIDPKDAAHIYAGPGSFADFYRPYPPEWAPSGHQAGDPPAAEAGPRPH